MDQNLSNVTFKLTSNESCHTKCTSYNCTVIKLILYYYIEQAKTLGEKHFRSQNINWDSLS